jgi:ADP-ribose pyrophosphatase YjhB (NUDIX family)
VPFGCLSEAEAHTIRYPNGDITHCFALLFLARRWRGEPNPNREEATEANFFGLSNLPQPIHAPTHQALNLLAAYRKSHTFQVR